MIKIMIKKESKINGSVYRKKTFINKDNNDNNIGKRRTEKEEWTIYPLNK